MIGKIVAFLIEFARQQKVGAPVSLHHTCAGSKLATKRKSVKLLCEDGEKHVRPVSV